MNDCHFIRDNSVLIKSSVGVESYSITTHNLSDATLMFYPQLMHILPMCQLYNTTVLFTVCSVAPCSDVRFRVETLKDNDIVTAHKTEEP